jgi:hypothetical protein
VTFQRDIEPTSPATDYAGTVTVTGPAGAMAGTVTEPVAGTLVWTPATPLPSGTYTGTVSGVSTTGTAGVPIRAPYKFTITIP